VKKHVLLFVTLAALVTLTPTAGSRAKRSLVTPFLKVGSQAILSNSLGPGYQLFTCQIANLNPSETCYDPYQVRHAYKIDTLLNSGFNGRGKTIVIIDAFQSPNIVQELNTYNSFYSLPGLNGLGGANNPALGSFTQIAPNGLTPFDPTNGDMVGWAEEITLDVLWSHAIAPGANIVLVLAKSDSDPDILSATRYAIEHNLGNVISQSFGESESCMDPGLLLQQHLLFVEATLKGMTLFASSGDFGSAQPTCDGSSLVKAVGTPASDPLVSAVGGTELHAARYCLASQGCNPAVNPAPGTYQGEIAWNEPDFGSTGGGFSVIFGEPLYQQGTIHGGKQRGVPDVSYSAAVLHGLLTYLNIPGIPAGFYLFGGTSAGSPQWAALLAIADQKAGYPLGFINAALYRIGQVQSRYSASFFDITSGNNALYVAGYSAGPGWDPTTGLGSPAADQLVNSLIQFASPFDALTAISGPNPPPGSSLPWPGHQWPH